MPTQSPLLFGPPHSLTTLTHTLPAPDYSIVGADEPASKSIPRSGTMRPNAYFVNDTHQYIERY